MGPESRQGIRELLAALRYRNGLFFEIQERVALQGWKSRCMYSGIVAHCTVPESSHCCLSSLRRKYAGSVKRVKAIRNAFPELIEDPEAWKLEEAYRTARKRRQPAALAS